MNTSVTNAGTAPYAVLSHGRSHSGFSPLVLQQARVRERRPDKSVQDHTMYFVCVEHDFEEPLELRIRRDTAPWRTVSVRPRMEGVTVHEEPDEIQMTLTEPAGLSVEFDGDMYHNLFVFAEQPDSEKPDPSDPNILYFGPGEHHPGMLELTSGQTLYLDTGAVVYGRIHAAGAENITIAGHGILDGAEENHDTLRPYHIHLEQCRGVRLENILIRDSPAWSVVTMYCKDVSVHGIKQISYNWNSDGFDICSCEDVTIDHVFVRNFDDNISLKSFGGDCRRITFRNAVVWCDCAHNMLVGPEADRVGGTVFEDILFENVAVLESREYCDTYMGVMAIMCADKAVIRNIGWRDIRVERLSVGKAISVQFVTEYAEELGRSIENISFEKIWIDQKIPVMTFHGADETRLVKHIQLQDVRYVNGMIHRRDELDINEYVDDLRIIG